MYNPLIFFLFSLIRFINARRRIVQPMIDASNRAGKSPVVTVYKSRKRKNSGSDSISPGPFPYPPMGGGGGGHYPGPYINEHYSGMYSQYHHNDLTGTGPTTPHAHYSPRSYGTGCSSDQHSAMGVNLPPQTSCTPMRQHSSSYNTYRTSPPALSAPQSPFLSHTHPSMMPPPTNTQNLHGYHQAHLSSLSYPLPPPHPYTSHDGLTPHGVMDMHNI